MNDIEISYIILLTDLNSLDGMVVKYLAKREFNAEYIFCHFNNDNPVNTIIEKWESKKIRYLKIPVGINSSNNIFEWSKKFAKGTKFHFISA